jgi:hypothetical protein
MRAPQGTDTEIVVHAAAVGVHNQELEADVFRWTSDTFSGLGGGRFATGGELASPSRLLSLSPLAPPGVRDHASVLFDGHEQHRACNTCQQQHSASHSQTSMCCSTYDRADFLMAFQISGSPPPHVGSGMWAAGNLEAGSPWLSDVEQVCREFSLFSPEKAYQGVSLTTVWTATDCTC